MARTAPFLFAQRELERIQTQRKVIREYLDSQSEENLDEESKRIILKFKTAPEIFERTPLEPILEYNVSQISHDDMMEELSNWEFTFNKDAEPDNPLGAREIGSWDYVTHAYHRDLLNDDDYDKLLGIAVCQSM